MLGMKFCLELKVIPLFIDILIKFGEDVLWYTGKERQTRSATLFHLTTLF